MRVILDTSVLWDSKAVLSLKLTKAQAVLPAIAFTERARQLREAGRGVSELWRLLDANEVVVEDFTAEMGLLVAANLPDKVWAKHSRDALIAGHVGADDVLWTKNPRDFLLIGLHKEQVVAV